MLLSTRPAMAPPTSSLKYVEQIWRHPVHLETKQGEKTVIFTCDGGNVTKG